MKGLMNMILVNFIAGLVLTSTAYAQSSCYNTVELAAPAAYSIEFGEDFQLNPIKSNGNWYSQVQAGRAFGCVIFAVKQTNGVLKGAYKAVSAQRLNSTCEGKQDYVYTQFVDSNGRRTFRLQCEYAVYEDNLPQPFAPTFEQAAKIEFDKGQKRSTKVVK